MGHGAGPGVPEQAHAPMNKQTAVPGLPVALMLPWRSVLQTGSDNPFPGVLYSCREHKPSGHSPKVPAN